MPFRDFEGSGSCFLILYHQSVSWFRISSGSSGKGPEEMDRLRSPFSRTEMFLPETAKLLDEDGAPFLSHRSQLSVCLRRKRPQAFVCSVAWSGDTFGRTSTPYFILELSRLFNLSRILRCRARFQSGSTAVALAARRNS